MGSPDEPVRDRDKPVRERANGLVGELLKGYHSGGRPEPTFTRHVDAVFPTLDELFGAGEAVRQLLLHPGWAHVARLVEAETATVDAQLDGQLLDSRAAYARLHGRRSGLRAMEEAAHAIVSKADRKLEQQRLKHEGAAEPALQEA